jgi:hypothetical protein
MALFQRLHAEGATIVMVTTRWISPARHTDHLLRDGRISGNEIVRTPRNAEKELADVADLDSDELLEAMSKHVRREERTPAEEGNIG